MLKSFKLALLVLPLSFNILSAVATVEVNKVNGQVGALTPEEEELITDRDRGARERPNLYDYNRQNIQYNERFGRDRDDSYYPSSRGNSYYNQQGSGNRPGFNYDDLTDTDLYFDR